MNELMITNIDNMLIRSYAIYYTNNERFYVIYTEKEKDENGYVILHIAKVLKEVNSTPEGIVPTGRFIGLEISDSDEWDAAKADISSIVANKQSGAPTSVKYLDANEISGINIKSSKIFKLRDDVVSSIIVEAKEEPVVAPITEEPVQAPISVNNDSSLEEPVLEQKLDNIVNGINDLPIAPNPFEFQPVETPFVEEKIEEEPAVPNPYDEIQRTREEEMVSQLANDNMQDIVPTPFIPVNELESKVLEETPVTLEEVSLDGDVLTTIQDEPIVLSEQVAPVTLNVEPIQKEVAEVPASEEVVSSESFVDSIVADVSDIVDNNSDIKVNSINHEIDSRYEKLYKEELEKTIELEKELKELQGKLNNIKNIIE